MVCRLLMHIGGFDKGQYRSEKQAVSSNKNSSLIAEQSGFFKGVLWQMMKIKLKSRANPVPKSW